MRTQRGRRPTHAITAAALVGVLVLASCEEEAPARATRISPSTEPVSPSQAPEVPTGIDLISVDPATGDTRVIIEAVGRQQDGERSTDGGQIVFEGVGPDRGPSQIYVLDGVLEPRRLTDLPGGAGDPTWSPDGRRIAFVSPVAGPRDTDIFVMRADGTRLRRVVGTRLDDLAPDWSPDGSRIAFQTRAWTEGVSRIWIASLDDGDSQRLTFDGDGDAFPTWSPDGRWIAFFRYDDAPTGNLEWDDSDLWVMRSDGSEQHHVVAGEAPLPHLAVDAWPTEMDEWGMSSPDSHFQGSLTWSPDGDVIAYTGGHCGCISLVRVRSGMFLDEIPGDLSDASWDAEGILVSGKVEM
jgi:Tol biopolymer transport system component